VGAVKGRGVVWSDASLGGCLPSVSGGGNVRWGWGKGRGFGTAGWGGGPEGEVCPWSGLAVKKGAGRRLRRKAREKKVRLRDTLVEKNGVRGSRRGDAKGDKKKWEKTTPFDEKRQSKPRDDT